ncbi:MAG: hypothetical protein IPM26_07280 [Saprospiraceae bacterium]|nr:hypothetical protein [Saprospiraceae bacterium]
MQRWIAVTLACAILLPVLTMQVWLHYEKYRIKKTVKYHIRNTIPRDELVELKFTQEEIKTKLRWEHSGEFEFQGQMYDVIDSYTCDNYLIYLCWRDHEETAINQKLRNYVENDFHQAPVNKDKKMQFRLFLKNLFIPDICSLADIRSSSIIIENMWHFSGQVLKGYESAETPPPQNS